MGIPPTAGRGHEERSLRRDDRRGPRHRAADEAELQDAEGLTRRWHPARPPRHEAADVHIIELEDEQISLNGMSVLAFSESLDWDIELVRSAGKLLGG